MSQTAAEYYLRKYLNVTPLSLALQRAVESKYLKTTELKKPVIDIGCGFGEFARVFVEDRVYLGVDNSFRELVNAKKIDKYRHLIEADARKLPIGSDSFKTAISVSSLEHIAGVEKVLDEIYRILEPGGRLVFTVVINSWGENIFFGPLLNKLGLAKLGKAYTDLFHKVFKHEVLVDRKEWERMVKESGFQIEESKEIASCHISKFFDMFLIIGWPAQMIKSLVGKRMVLRPKFIEDWFTKIFLKYVEEEPVEGTNLFLVAKKPTIN